MAASRRHALNGRRGSRLVVTVETLAPAFLTALAIVLITREQGGYFATSWGWSILAMIGVVITWLISGPRTELGRLDVGFVLTLFLLVGWAAVSISWSIDRAESVLEVERLLVLATGCFGILVLARRRGAPELALALFVAIAGICAYSLWTRLFPTATSFDPRDPVAGYRLFEPVGYWNALGMFAATGIVLALGFASEPGIGWARRALASVCLVVLPVTLFFTFSRGGWAALACGLIVVVAHSPHRLRLVVTTAVFAIAPAVAVWLASRSTGLTDSRSTIGSASSQGHRLAAIIVLLALGSAGLVPVLSWVERRLTLNRSTRRAFGAALLGLAALVVAAALVRGGGPVTLAHRAYDSFVAAAPTADPQNENSRLLTLNGNGRAVMWRVAVDAAHGRWLGGAGAGSYERSWERSPKADEIVRDAHGLYVQTLSELGIVGLALLAALLALPLVAAVRLRHVPFAPAVAGAYAVFVLHNAVDWDWQLSGIALTGLLVGCLLLVMRREGAERPVGTRVRLAGGVAAIVVAAFAVVATIGNEALARAQTANADQRYAAAAADARIARRWMFWSATPLEALGEAQLRQGQVELARASFQQAVKLDPGNWQAWLDLAAAVQDPARTEAVARARELYPTSPEIAEFVAEARAAAHR